MSYLSGSQAQVYRRGSDDDAARVHSDRTTPLQEAVMTTHTSFWRRLSARAPLLASMAGMSLVLTSVVFFFVEDDLRRILGVTAGLFFLLLAIWYAAHPFFREERIYLELRRDIEEFIGLTRQLHYAAIQGDDAAFESIEERIPDQVQIVIATARKSRAPGPVRVEGRVARLSR